MKVIDKANNWARGEVTSRFINVKTGETFGPAQRHNVITYSAADIMAQLIGGHIEYTPAYMGFIYSPGLTATMEAPSTRVHTWDVVANDIANVIGTANMLVTPVISNPTISIDGDYYTGNAITLRGQTSARTEYAFDTEGSTYAPALADGNRMLQACLLTRLVSGSAITYIPFARVSLIVGSSFQAKPVGSELALDWQVSFK